MEYKDVLSRVEEYILANLEEIEEERLLGNDCEFAQGKVYGLVECLEIIWGGRGVDVNEMLALEARYGIRQQLNKD